MLNILYRSGNILLKFKVPFANILFKFLIRLICNSVVEPKNQIGSGTKFAYGGISTVIHVKAVIGKNCLIGPNVVIGGRSKIKKVPTIGDNVYIGSSAIIIGDVKIGNNTIIGAGSVVTKNVPPSSVVKGNPAKIKKIEKNKKNFL